MLYTNLKCFFEQDYYTNEPLAYLVLQVPPSWQGVKANITLGGPNFPALKKELVLRPTSKLALGLQPVLDSALVQVLIEQGSRQYVTCTANLVKITDS